MEEKFRGLAEKHLPRQQLDNLLKQLWALETLPQAATLVEMTRSIA
jgi:hypothetical protein